MATRFIEAFLHNVIQKFSFQYKIRELLAEKLREIDADHFGGLFGVCASKVAVLIGVPGGRPVEARRRDSRGAGAARRRRRRGQRRRTAAVAARGAVAVAEGRASRPLPAPPPTTYSSVTESVGCCFVARRVDLQLIARLSPSLVLWRAKFACTCVTSF